MPNLRPFSHGVGAEVIGVDLNNDQPQDIVDFLIDAWNRHAVLLFRNQRLSRDDQDRFTRYFGEVQKPKAVPRDGGLYIGNVDMDGIPSTLPLGEMCYHQDGCYTATPNGKTLLYALEVPPAGGNTKFASTSLAYSRQPDDVRERLLGYDVTFTFDYGAGTDPSRPLVHDESWNAGLQYTHPLVIAHPFTGEPLLFCNPLMAHSIMGLPKAESDALIARLCAEYDREDNLYEHVWSVGDLLVWDNLATVHARTDFDPNHRRLLWRTTVAGTQPVAYRSTVAQSV